jgi:hypothetical protein
MSNLRPRGCPKRFHLGNTRVKGRGRCVRTKETGKRSADKVLPPNSADHNSGVL